MKIVVSHQVIGYTILVMLLAALDVAFTLGHIEVGGCEMNPVMNWILFSFGKVAFVSCKMIFTGIGIFILVSMYDRFLFARVGFWGVLIGHVILLGYHIVLAVSHW
jgi:hypothetical protein